MAESLINKFCLCLCLGLCLCVSLFAVSEAHVSLRSRLYMQARGFSTKSDAFSFTGRLTPGTVGPSRTVPKHIIGPDYALDGIPKKSRGGSNPWEITPATDEDIQLMRMAGRYAREVLDIAVRQIKPGITTDSIDAVVHEATIARDCYPSPLNYHRFPKSCCTSVNEIICHGIPDSTVLLDGDIVNIDVTVFYKGVHGDCSETVLVGDSTSEDIRDLVYTTYLSLQKSIEYCEPGKKYNKIGGIIEDLIKPKGYTTVPDFCGHG
jgi:methionyl aminopeptidase